MLKSDQLSSVAGLLEIVGMNQLERATPAGLGNKVLAEIHQMLDIEDRSGQPLGRRVIRPVDDQRLAYDVCSRHKAPETAVE